MTENRVYPGLPALARGGGVVIPIIVAWKKMTETHFLSGPIHIYFI